MLGFLYATAHGAKVPKSGIMFFIIYLVYEDRSLFFGSLVLVNGGDFSVFGDVNDWLGSRIFVFRVAYDNLSYQF